ncbi:UNVERIFIED_CONTAM: hypothetical protein FKN15_075977 [Acipenser sinensis]
MHRLIMSSSDLLEKLVTLYPLTALHLKSGADIDITESSIIWAYTILPVQNVLCASGFRLCMRKEIVQHFTNVIHRSTYKNAFGSQSPTDCLKICYVIRYWITEFWIMFQLDSNLTDTMEQFQELVRENREERHCRLIDTTQINAREWSRKITQRIKANSSKKRKVSLLFDHLEPEELAEHLTYLEFKSFRRITFADYQNYVVNGCVKENPAMERSIALCNGISQWVQLMVLSRPTAQLRAEVFTKFINVAQKLHEVQNFNTLMAVVGGLCHSSISRLKETSSHVPNEVNKRSTYKNAFGSQSPTDCLKICYVIRYWITEFWIMFQLDSNLTDTMEQFQELVRENREERHCRLIDTTQINAREWSRKITQRIKANSSKKRKVSLLFDHLEPEELAEHLTYLEFKSFRRITFADYQNYVVNGCVKENPAMERSIALCNGISQWVQLMVLSRPTAQLRAEVFTKFINVAQKLHEVQNFNTLMAVVGGLCHSSISRLKETSSHVPNEVNKRSTYKNAFGSQSPTDCLKICYVIRYWITEFWIMFQLDSNLTDTMEQFQELVRENKEETHCRLIDTTQINAREWSRKITQRIKANSSKKRKVSLLFDHLEPEELAEHLTYLEFKSFRRITFADYQNYVVNGCVKENPAMERSIALCNGISQWVQLMVLSRPTAQLRAEVFTKFINVAQVLNEMTELLSSCRNYDNYRRVYSECTGFKIPILGVHLKDLISVHEAMPDYVEDKKINVQKLQTLYNHIHELIVLQQLAPRLDANKDLVHLLTLSLDLYYSEDEIYELSYGREPRNSKALSVFKNYDHDQNGYISQEDFEKIAASFPFSFCVMDKEKEGLISREEITAYFMRASVICSKLGLGFIHNFQETTYMKPTFCDNCAGFLWGVIKQGYRCRDCGMNCHKQCKDLVAFECKKNAKNTAADNSATSSSTPTALCTPGVRGYGHGSEDGQFTYLNGEGVEHSDKSKEWEPTLASVSEQSHSGEPKAWAVNKSTQTEWPQSPESVFLLPAPLSPCPSPLTPCPSPVPVRKRAYAKWENRASTVKPTYEQLEMEKCTLQKSNETLRRKLKASERDVEVLQTLLKRHTLHPLDPEDSS